MKTQTVSILAISLFLFSGCVGMLHPLHKKEQIVTLDSLEGSWFPKDFDMELWRQKQIDWGALEMTWLRFHRLDKVHYHMFVDNRKPGYVVTPFRMAGQSFLSITSPAHQAIKNTGRLPLFSFMGIQRDEGRLSIKILNPEWLAAWIKDHPEQKTFVPGHVPLMTSTTGRSQQFITKHLANEKAWKVVELFRSAEERKPDAMEPPTSLELGKNWVGAMPSLHPFALGKQQIEISELFAEKDLGPQASFTGGLLLEKRKTIIKGNDSGAVYDVTAFKIGERYFIQLSGHQTAEVVVGRELSWPMHYMFLAKRVSGGFDLYTYDIHWLKNYLVKHPDEVAHYNSNPRPTRARPRSAIYLSAPSTECQRFFLAHLNDRFLGKSPVLHLAHKVRLKKGEEAERRTDQ